MPFPMRFVLALALLVSLAACSTTSLESVSDFDREFDFTKVKRFAILPIDRTSAAETLISDMQVSRINEALAAELSDRGYEIVDERSDADLYLSWHLVTREKTDIRSYNASSVYNCWRCGPPVSDVSVRQHTEGTFIVDLIDPSRNRSVWRSTIQSRLNKQPSPEQAAENRATAAKAIFVPFPPSDEASLSDS